MDAAHATSTFALMRIRTYRESDPTVSIHAGDLPLSHRIHACMHPGFSMTLFQSLANAAGYDPAKGPGSSCSAEGSSGQCVLPWAGGHKTVSSVVLVANGVSFAVRYAIRIWFRCMNPFIRSRLGHDVDFHHHRVCRRLWDLWKVAPAHPHSYLLGCPVREHVLDLYVCFPTTHSLEQMATNMALGHPVYPVCSTCSEPVAGTQSGHWHPA